MESCWRARKRRRATKATFSTHLGKSLWNAKETRGILSTYKIQHSSRASDHSISGSIAASVWVLRHSSRRRRGQLFLSRVQSGAIAPRRRPRTVLNTQTEGLQCFQRWSGRLLERSVVFLYGAQGFPSLLRIPKRLSQVRRERGFCRSPALPCSPATLH